MPPPISPLAAALRRLPAIVLGLALTLLVNSALAGEPSRHRFDLPVDAAERSLRRLAEISGLEVIFSTELANGIRTNAVQGEFSALEAARRMLLGTPLEASQTAATDAIVVSRRTPASPAENNSAGPPPPITTRSGPPNGADEVITLNPFEVQAAESTEYRALSATSATRVRVDIKRVPATINVVTSELIRDAGIEKLDEVLRYTPGAAATDDVRGGGNSVNLRGFIVNQLQFNGFTLGGDAGQINSPALANRVEIAKGPSSLLYGQIKPGGVFNLVPKQASLTNRGEVTVGAGTSAYERAELDVNRTLVPGKLGARLYGFYQDQDFQADFAGREQYAAMPSFKWRPTPKLELNGLLLYYRKNDRPIPNQSNANVIGSLDARGAPVNWSYANPPNLRTAEVLRVPATVINGQGEEVATGTGATGGRTRAGDIFDTYDLRWGPTVSENGPDALRRVESTLGTLEGIVAFNERLTSRTMFFYNDSSRETSSVQGGNAVYGNGNISTLRIEANFGDYDETALRQEFLGTFELGRFGKLNLLAGYEHRRIEAAGQNWVVRDAIELSVDQRPTFANPHIDPALLRIPGGSAVRTNPLYHGGNSTAGSLTRDDRDGFYLTGQLDAWEDRLFLLAGVRRDEAEQRNRDPRNPTSQFGRSLDFKDTVGQLGASFALTSHLTTFASWSESGLPNGFDQDGNPFAPELGEGVDVGLKLDRLFGGRMTGTVALFEVERSNILRQELILDLNGNFLRSITRTSGVERSRGVEWDLSFSPAERWTLLVGGAYLDSEIVNNPQDREDEGLPTRGAPQWSYFAFGNYRFARTSPLAGLTLGGGFNYYDETQTEDLFLRQLRRTQSVTLADVFASYDFRAWERPITVRLNVTNLFDTTRLARDKNWTEPREFRFHVTTRF